MIDWLRGNGHWLLVFDNAAVEQELLDFRPKGNHDGHVLITSRNPNFDVWMRKPQQAERLQSILRVEFMLVFKRSPVDGVQEIDRNGCDPESLEVQDHIDDVRGRCFAGA